ncbi:transporter [Strepomyces sp. STD 3.1]|uniref:sodium:solute symporter family transporter n=1 Tax=Streptomyces sp. NPDC058985 TaxID=3346684 RepID=UPI001F17A672|nr:transporter [Streptomyces sp. STD 3.1]
MTAYLPGPGTVTAAAIGSEARAPVIIAFLLFIGLSLLWMIILTTQEDHPEKLYLAGRSLSPRFNGVAMAGEQISVVTLLAVPGAIALYGYDGYIAAIDVLITLGVLLLLAQKIRESGRYTLGDLFGLRATGTAPRIAATVVTLVIAVPLIMIQLRAAGISAAFLIGMSDSHVQVICTVLMGCLVACFAAVSDLRGTSFMQVVKVPLTLLTLTVVTLLALAKSDWDPGALLSAAVTNSAAPDDYLSPRLWTYAADVEPLNALGGHLVVILGTAVTPHLILRVGASRTGRSARRSTSVATGLVGAFVLLLMTTGFAAAAVVGSGGIRAVDAIGQASPILLASGVLPDHSTARTALITVMACVAFLAVLTTVTSVAFAAAVSLARDVFRPRAMRADRADTSAGEIRTLRLGVAVLCLIGLSLAAATHDYPVEFLLTFATCVAATCVFPALLYSLFWPRFDRRGLLWSVYGGLLLCVALTFFSPTVSGTPYAVWPDADFDWFPLETAGLVSVPGAFLLGWLGSRTGRREATEDLVSARR